MRKMRRSIMSLLTLCHLSRLTIFGVPGGSETPPRPKDGEDLRVRFGSRLPEGFYRTFDQAVEWQREDHPNRARALYGTLTEKLKSHAPELCERVQPFIDHNVNLLRR
jgi:hypothetical protein